MICNKHRSKGPRLGFIIRDRSADSWFVRAGDTVGGPEGTKELSWPQSSFRLHATCLCLPVVLWDVLLPAGREGLWQLSLSLRDSFIPLAAPCLSLQWSCTGSPGDPESLAQKLQEGGRELVSRNTAQLRASLRKNLGKEENIFKKGKKKKSGEGVWGQVSELLGGMETCRNHLPYCEAWKQPTHKACESSSGAKKGATLLCVNQDFQSVWKQVLGSGAEGGQAREIILWELWSWAPCFSISYCFLYISWKLLHFTSMYCIV